MPHFDEEDIPIISEEDVKEAIDAMDGSKYNVSGDIPVKLIKQISDQLAMPVANMLNAAIRQGCYILKLEMVPPVPKIFPPKCLDDLRNISGLLNMDKIAEKILSKMMI